MFRFLCCCGVRYRRPSRRLVSPKGIGRARSYPGVHLSYVQPADLVRVLTYTAYIRHGVPVTALPLY